MPHPRSLVRAVVALASISVSLLVALVALATGELEVGAVRAVPIEGGANREALLNDDAVRERLIDELAQQAKSIFDSHPDPDVGRVLIPRLSDVEFAGARVTTNGVGMPERDYALPKKKNVVRVVIVGDSRVFGMGAAQSDRMGAVLERMLEEACEVMSWRVECLDLGVPSWNVLAECSWIRRQLGDLQPDLVVQFMVPNDVNDNLGVRGFGGLAGFNPSARHRADGVARLTLPGKYLSHGATNHLRAGLDWESASRARGSLAEMRRLAEAVEAYGGRYLFVAAGTAVSSLLGAYGLAEWDAEDYFVLSDEFMKDRSFWVAPDDGHWNRAGHARLAHLLYGLIVERDLLPRLDVPLSETSASEITALEGPLGKLHRVPGVRSELDFREPESALLQVHAGVDGSGRVSPYASILMRNSGSHLLVDGACFERPEIDGGTVRVFVDEAPLDEFRIRAGEPIALSIELPARLAKRRFVSVRFVSSDWILMGPDQRSTLSFRLSRLALLSPED